MESNKLKLNDNKTDQIMIGTELHQTRWQTTFQVKCSVTIHHHHKLLESMCCFDSNLSLHQYISQVCKSCFYHMRDFRRIRYHVSLCSAKTTSVILSNCRLDYCNSLLNNIAKKTYLNSIVYIIV